jgi:EAL domain-containing protein (putative c-di-GMP-specific phosphodiesterase class I)/ActR/RegA family two-component response regulator
MSDIKPKPVADAASAGLVLLVDDELSVLHTYGRILREAGFSVVVLSDACQMNETLDAWPFDAVITDIRMPGTTGIDVLRTVRARDRDLPVILVTAGGDLQSAVDAVTHGALRYLLKPVKPRLLVESATEAIRLRRLALVQQRAFELFGRAAVKEASLGERFERALQSLSMAYQPIVRWSEHSVFAYEALVRNDEPLLRAPDALFDAAEKLGRLFDVGRAVRKSVADTMERLGPPCVFVNLHPRDLEDPEILNPRAPLSRVASRVVLEVTERASLAKVGDLRATLASLRRLGYRTAIDDLGAGYAGLTWFAQLEPDVVKLDMSLTRSIDTELTKQKLVESMTRLCTELDILVVGEGVETASERNALAAIGCDLLQGYHFAKPGAPFPTVHLEPRVSQAEQGARSGDRARGGLANGHSYVE